MLEKIPDIRVSVLVDNTASRPDLSSEHGLSLHIETPGASVLFDTGQSGLVVRNAAEMGIDLSQVTAIALSHGHFDHTGGLRAVMDIAEKAKVYAHAAAFGKHFGVSKEGKVKDGSSPVAADDMGGRLKLSGEISYPATGLALTGEVPRVTDFEDTGGNFFLDFFCRSVDTLPDDQSLVAATDSGAVLLLGCAHSGVVNTMEHVCEKFGYEKINVVMGGMHLLHASRDRLEKTAEAIERFGVKKIGPMHCTGKDAMRFLGERFGDRVFFPGAGDVFQF